MQVWPLGQECEAQPPWLEHTDAWGHRVDRCYLNLHLYLWSYRYLYLYLYLCLYLSRCLGTPSRQLLLVIVFVSVFVSVFEQSNAWGHP